MREFFIKDKNKNVAFRGIVPSNDVNCPPLDYFRYAHAEQCYNYLSSILKCKCPIEIPEQYMRRFAVKQVDKQLNILFSSTDQKPEIHQLLTNDDLSYKEQKKLLHGLHLKAVDILWLNKEAQDLGYLLDIYPPC